MLLKNNMTKTIFSSALIIMLALLISIAGTPIFAQERTIPHDLRNALAGIVRGRLVKELEGFPEITGEEKVDQRAVRGWLGDRLGSSTGAKGTLTWRVKPDSPRQKMVLNCTKATLEQIPRMNNQWRLVFRFEATVPCDGRASFNGRALLIPGSASSNFFGNLNVKADAILIITLNSTGMNYEPSVENVIVTQSGFAFTNEIAKLANSKLRSEVQKAIDNSIKPDLANLLKESLRDFGKNNSNGIRNLVGISASNVTIPPPSSSYSLAGTWKSGNNALVISSEGFTHYIAGRHRSYYYSYNKITGDLIAKDANKTETKISVQWIDKDSFRWTSPNGTRIYQRKK